ncbi:VWA domain-containing protein [Verrucomicrobiota bacterium]
MNLRTNSDPLIRDTHTGAAVISCVLSVLIHGVMLYSLATSEVKFAVTSSGAVTIKKVKSMRLIDVIREESYAKQLPAGRSEGALISEGSLMKRTEAFAMTPDKALIEPPHLTEGKLSGEMETIKEHSIIPERQVWDPRQEIVAIEKEVIDIEIEGLERRRIPKVERVGDAPDYVAPVDRENMIAATSVKREFSIAEPQRAEMSHETVEGTDSEASLQIGESQAGILDGLFQEDVGSVTEIKPIEDFLTVEISTYTSFRDRKYGYFKIEIERAGSEILPVVPKDIILVQDCSASMAEQRLYFCRTGMVSCLTHIGAEDRFNVVSFRDRAGKCFDSWAANKPAAIEKATQFIKEMRSEGNTDIYSSIKDLAKIKRISGRPVIALVVTDGRPTTGLTDSSDIIGEFTKLNKGAISVFTMGTIQTANDYLLDLLSSCNRGEASIVEGGRWGIPDFIQDLLRGVSRPVLTDVTFRFADSPYMKIEVYPTLMSNLYLDRPLVMYGRYARGMDRVVFQTLGRAGSKKCDMIFDLSLEKDAKRGDKTIRNSWAEQKIYHLIGEYTQKRESLILKEIDNVSKVYGVRVPYRKRL